MIGQYTTKNSVLVWYGGHGFFLSALQKTDRHKEVQSPKGKRNETPDNNGDLEDCDQKTSQPSQSSRRPLPPYTDVKSVRTMWSSQMAIPKRISRGQEMAVLRRP